MVLTDDARVVTSRLRAIRAILRTAAGLDRQQRRKLHGIRPVMRAVRLLRLQKQVAHRQREQGLDACNAPRRRRFRAHFLSRYDEGLHTRHAMVTMGTSVEEGGRLVKFSGECI